MPLSRALLALGVGLAASAPRVAQAEVCGRPDLRATFPGDTASEVPLDAALSAIYAETADYLGEAVELQANGAPLPVTPEFDASERRLFLRNAPLEPATSYTLTWPALRGLSSAGHGLGKTITFTTGTQGDLDSPEFTGIRRLDWDLEQVRDECTDDLEQRFRFDFELGEANDDGGAGSLALLLFQTRGPAVHGDMPRLLEQRALPATHRARLELTVEDTTGHVCFAAVVRDLVGRISATGSDEHCVDTTAPPFFYGCSLGGATRESQGGVLGLALVCAWLAQHRRSGRRG